MKELEKELGTETDLEISFKEGKAVIAVKYDGKGADAAVSVALDSDYFLQKLAEAIPGEIDDAIIDMLRIALKAQ